MNKFQKFFQKIFGISNAVPFYSAGSTRSYMAARQDRTTADMGGGDYKAADYDVFAGMVILRARARFLMKNNSYARKFQLLCRQNIIGADGFILQNKAKDLSGNFDSFANQLIEYKWSEWCNKNYCTTEGLMSFKAVQDLIVKTVPVDGEIFIRKVTGKKVNKFGFSLQLIEPDLVDERMNRVLDNGNVVRMGIEYNASTRRPLAYYFKNVNPTTELWAGYTTVNDYTRFDASEIIHLYDKDRANQSRGVSWLAPVMVMMHNLSEFERYAVTNARIGASKMGFFKKPENPMNPTAQTGNDNDAFGNRVMDIEPGTFDSLEAGWDFVPFMPQFPEAQHEPFVKSMLRGIASGLGVSYNTLASDLEGVNYSSIRAGLLDERDNWKRLQAWIIESFLDDVFESWLDWALLTGELALPVQKFDKFNSPTWIGRRWQWVDPLKDVNANIQAVRAGFKTNSQVIAELGGDIQEVYEQLAYESQLKTDLGLVIEDTKL